MNRVTNKNYKKLSFSNQSAIILLEIGNKKGTKFILMISVNIVV